MEEAEEGEAEEEPWSMADMDLRRTMGDPCITVAGERGGGGGGMRITHTCWSSSVLAL